MFILKHMLGIIAHPKVCGVILGLSVIVNFKLRPIEALKKLLVDNLWYPSLPLF